MNFQCRQMGPICQVAVHSTNAITVPAVGLPKLIIPTASFGTITNGAGFGFKYDTGHSTETRYITFAYNGSEIQVRVAPNYSCAGGIDYQNDLDYNTFSGGETIFRANVYNVFTLF